MIEIDADGDTPPATCDACATPHRNASTSSKIPPYRPILAA